MRNATQLVRIVGWVAALGLLVLIGGHILDNVRREAAGALNIK